MASELVLRLAPHTFDPGVIHHEPCVRKLYVLVLEGGFSLVFLVVSVVVSVVVF